MVDSKKIIFIIGTRKKKSRIYGYLDPIIDELTSAGNKVQVISPDKYPMSPCEGCTNCFFTMKCVLDFKKDRNSTLIKKALLSSDIIVFVSPTFLHNVSGDFKTFLDRIAYWTHLLPLAGKNGLAISFTDNNGGKIVSDYLEKIMTLLGINVVLNESVAFTCLGGDTEVIRRLSNIKKTLFWLVNDNAAPIDYGKLLLANFNICKARYSGKKFNTSEFIYWNQKEILAANTFPQYVKAIKKLSYKYF